MIVEELVRKLPAIQLPAHVDTETERHMIVRIDDRGPLPNEMLAAISIEQRNGRSFRHEHLFVLDEYGKVLARVRPESPAEPSLPPPEDTDNHPAQTLQEAIAQAVKPGVLPVWVMVVEQKGEIGRRFTSSAYRIDLYSIPVP